MNSMRSLALLFSLIPAASFGMEKFGFGYPTPSSGKNFGSNNPAYTPNPESYFHNQELPDQSYQEHGEQDYAQNQLSASTLFHCAMSGNFSDVKHEIKNCSESHFSELLNQIPEIAAGQFKPQEGPAGKGLLSSKFAADENANAETKSRIIERIELFFHTKEDQTAGDKKVDPIIKGRIMAVYHAVDASLKPFAVMPFSMKMAFLSAPQKAGLAGMTLLAAVGAYKIVDWLFAKPARPQMAGNMPPCNNDTAYAA